VSEGTKVVTKYTSISPKNKTSNRSEIRMEKDPLVFEKKKIP
jgi:hypothetical protein